MRRIDISSATATMVVLSAGPDPFRVFCSETFSVRVLAVGPMGGMNVRTQEAAV